jgi:hypothetical protein
MERYICKNGHLPVTSPCAGGALSCRVTASSLEGGSILPHPVYACKFEQGEIQAVCLLVFNRNVPKDMRKDHYEHRIVSVVQSVVLSFPGIFRFLRPKYCFLFYDAIALSYCYFIHGSGVLKFRENRGKNIYPH